MERLTIKYWQGLPNLVDKLQGINSPLMFEWKDYFNPSRNYMTSIDFEDVRIEFEGDYWRVATRLFQSFCYEYDIRLNIDRYIWLAENTKILNNSLIGSEEFNRYVYDNRGYDEVEEFVNHNKLVNWHGEDFELYYNYRDMEMIQRLGFEVMPNRFQYRSKSGYYLPIDIEIRYNPIITKWLRREGSNSSKYQVTHSPKLTIIGLTKTAVFDLARYLYKNEGLSELIVGWVEKPNKTDFKIKIGDTEVYIKDGWAEENEEYIKVAKDLQSISGYESESFRLMDILRHSKFTEYGIALEDEYYYKLNLPEQRIIGDKVHLGFNQYSFEPLSLGSGTPITVNVGDMKIQTPYEYIKAGLYKDPLYPLTEPYEADTNDLDLDIRVVLGIKPKVEEKEIDFIGDMMGSVRLEEYRLGDYKQPTDTTPLKENVKIVDIQHPEGVEPKRLTYTNSDFTNVPYILSLEETGDWVKVTYIDGDTLELHKNDANLRSRIVFKDRVGVKLKPFIGKYANLLMSLSTDKLEHFTATEEEGYNAVETSDIITSWLEALVSRRSNDIYEKIKGVDVGEKVVIVEDEDDFDIFSDIELI